MFSGWPLPVLLVVFIVGAVAVWIAGIQLSTSTDQLAQQFGFGQAFGGLIFLAVATNLPEMAITATAGLTHNLDIATGNLLGGIAIQTVVLVFLDVFGVGAKGPFSSRASSLILVLEGLLVIVVLIVSIMGTQLPSWVIFARLTPASLLMPVAWLVGLWLIKKARNDLPWQNKGHAPPLEDEQESKTGSQNKKAGASSKKDEKKGNAHKHGAGTTRTIIVFAIACAVTLVAGAALEMSGDAISNKINLNSVIFGATFLAAATALPEVSTGFESVKIGDYEMAFSDIFGGNAFLPVLFLLAELLSGQSVLARAQHSDIYLGALGILVTSFYIYGLIFRPRRQVLRMGIDSLLVLILYVIGIAGLITIAHG